MTKKNQTAASKRIGFDSRESFKKRLSIAMLAPCPFPTHQGTQVFIRHLATALSRAGHTIHLITYGYGEYDEDWEFHLHRAARIHAGLRSGPNFKKPAADAVLMMTAARVAKTHNCDLWHVHNVEGLGLGALLKLQTGMPLVYHAHNAMGPELPTYFRAHLAQAFASLLGDILDRTLPKAADAVITFDEDHKALHEIYGVPEERIRVIPPGLLRGEMHAPSAETMEKVQSQFGEGPILLYAGNPDAYQNLDLLWESFAIVRSRRPDVQLVIATHHAPNIFQKQIPKNWPLDNIHIYQFEKIEELQALFSIACMGLSPRTLWTGAPIKILNYLATGLPVVACRSSARHILTPDSGLLVEGNADTFAAAILRLLEQPIGNQEKRHQVSKRYQMENQVSLYESAYEFVLASNA